jgi:hypothetical protein
MEIQQLNLKIVEIEILDCLRRVLSESIERYKIGSRVGMPALRG